MPRYRPARVYARTHVGAVYLALPFPLPLFLTSLLRRRRHPRPLQLLLCLRPEAELRVGGEARATG